MSESVLKDGLPYKIERSLSTKPFWDGLNEGKFLTTKCDKCSTLHFPPTTKLCPVCFGTKMEWQELPLIGTVTTWTKVDAPPEGFSGNYILASVMVDTLNKPILGRYLGERIKTNDRVKIGFEKIKDQSIIVFTKLD